MLAFLAAAALAGHAGAAPDGQAADAALEARIGDASLALDAARDRLERLHGKRAAIEASVAKIEAYGKLPDLGREFVETVLAQLRALPRPRPLLARVEADRAAVAASDAHLRTLRELGQFGQLGPPGDVPALPARAHESLVRLEAVQRDLVKSLHAHNEAERDLERWSADASARLLRLLYWVPVRPGWQTVGELSNAAAWSVSPANWSQALRLLGERIVRPPYAPLLALVLAAALLVARGRLVRMLVATAPDARPAGAHGLGHAFGALGITLALALPVPLVMYTAGSLLHNGGDPFARALSETLSRVGQLLFALVALAWTLDPRGIAIRHFGWNARALAFLSAAVRRFTLVFVPLTLVVALNGIDAAPFGNRESIARLGTIVIMALMVRFLFRALGSRSVPMEEARTALPRSWVVRFHGAWFAALAAFPLAILALGAAGYFIAAAFIFGRVVTSLFLVLAALMLYGFMAVWVRQQQARLERQRDLAAATAAPGRDGARTEDIAAITERTRSLLDLAVTLLLLAGMWLVWRDLMPALSEIGDYVLWTHTSSVDGKDVQLPLTVGHVLLAALTGVVTFVAVRNIGALLDVALLRRLDLQDDATYAIKVTARYMAAMLGVVIAARILGIAWNDVQWLVAALSVGLGFGLQEIVANFVAGLIVLIERPVRIGDVVTIGDVSGTVARIHARVLTLVDFDNKEVLIPNKSLITDRVINWTLSSQTTRLVQRIDVAPGTDLALAQRVILDAVQRNPDVLREPGPRVFMVAFGTGGALSLEINAFVGSFESRQRVQHEINVAVDEALRASGIRAA